MMYFRRMSLAGFTLTELLIATTLVGMIILAIVALDISSRRFLSSSRNESRVQNQISPIIELMVKDISRGIGSQTNPGIKTPTSAEIRIRQIRQIPEQDWPTYSDYSDDSWTAYRFVEGTKTIERLFCSDSDCDNLLDYIIVAENIVDCEFNFSIPIVSITVTARKVATSGASVTNPEVRLETTIIPRLQSS